MVYSASKRTRTTSGSSTEEDQGYYPNLENSKPHKKPTRVPKCYTKNALIARENRLKKKLYISNLEDDVSTLKRQNKNLSTVVENQSHLIQDLKQEIKYLKSVLSNSDGIGKLIKNINLSTGMSVTSSLKLELNEDSFKPEIARKTAHPWEENNEAFDQKFASLPTPESTTSYCSNPDFDYLNNQLLLNDIDMPIDITDNELLNILDEQSLEATILPLDDHNYHYQPKEEDHKDDAGVCLHVCNNKVSLEFCQNCSQKAQQTWATQT